MASFHRLKHEIGELVLSRFNYQCQSCGSSENLCVHHVQKMKPNTEQYNDVSNLTVLCKSCHMSHHRLAGDVISPNPPRNHGGRRGNHPPIKCCVEGCDIMQHAKSLCKKHYARMLRAEGRS